MLLNFVLSLLLVLCHQQVTSSHQHFRTQPGVGLTGGSSNTTLMDTMDTMSENDEVGETESEVGCQVFVSLAVNVCLASCQQIFTSCHKPQ